MTSLFWLALLASSVIFGQASSPLKRNVCTPSSARNSSIDDVPAIREALSSCGNGGTIVISAGETFSIRTPLDFSNCSGCEFQLEGTLKVSEDLHFWENKIVFLIQNVTNALFHSLTGSGLIDGSGQKYWDEFGKNKTFSRPFLIHFINASNTTFTKIKLKDSPFWFLTLNGSSTNITLTDLVLSAVSTSRYEAINTDGIDTCECSHVTISNIHITNDDDCVSFKKGSNYITINNITCVGSRGISVGSAYYLPGLSTIKNVYVSNVKMINGTVAARLKVLPKRPSPELVLVSNVTIRSLTVDNCDFAFRVQTCYNADNATCLKYPSDAIFSDIKLIDFTGTTSKEYDPAVANINCPPKGTCDLTFVGWNIVSPSKNSTVLCNHYDHPSGVTCTPGAFG